MVNIEEMPIPEKNIITPEDELDYIKKAVEQENENKIMDCLNRFSSKVSELPNENKERLIIKLEEIKSALQSADLEKSYKNLSVAIVEAIQEQL
ncbi:MAG: hypothetical protein ABIJ91_05490 [Candidatus Kuenenbacteria bacterium]